MNYQEAIDRALALRLRARKEADSARRNALLGLAQEWEVWAERCREQAARDGSPDPAAMPPEDIA